MYEPELIKEINEGKENNNKCLLLGYEKIDEEKENEDEFEEEEDENININNINDINKKIKEEKIDEYKNKITKKIEEINQAKTFYENKNSEKIIYDKEKDKNWNFRRRFNITPRSNNITNLNKTSYIKTLSDENSSKNNYNLTETNKNTFTKYNNNKNNIVNFPVNNFINKRKENNDNKYVKNIKYKNNNYENNNNYDNNCNNNFSNKNNNYYVNQNQLSDNKKNKILLNNENKKENKNKNKIIISKSNNTTNNVIKNKKNVKKNKKEKSIDKNKNNNKDIGNISNDKEEIIEINKKPDNLELKKKYYRNPYRDSLAQNNMQLKEIKLKIILSKEEYEILMREKARFNNPLIDI